MSLQTLHSERSERTKEVLKVFSGFTFRGVDVPSFLAVPVYSSIMFQKPAETGKYDWRYPVFRQRHLFLWNAARYLSTPNRDLKAARYVFLLSGKERTKLLSLPIIEALGKSSCALLFSSSPANQVPGTASSAGLKNLPAPMATWERELSKLWPEFLDRIDMARKQAQVDQRTCYTLLSALAWGVLHSLRAEAALEQLRPAIVVVEHDRQPAEAVFCQVARKKGIPSATLVHGLIGDRAVDSLLWAPLVADAVIVWGEWMRDAFRSFGVDERRILDGGYPRLNPLTQQDTQSAAEKLRTAGGPARPVALLLSSNLSSGRQAARQFFAASGAAPGWRFMVRPHPEESLDWYQRHAPNGLSDVQDPRTWSIAQSLASASVVVGSASTACFDAFVLGKPLVLLPDQEFDLNDIPLFRELLGEGCIQYAATPAALASLLRAWQPQAAPGSQPGSAVRRYASSIGAEAAVQSAKWIEGIALRGAPGQPLR